MARRGRVSEEEKLKPHNPIYKQNADDWLKYINSIYDEYKIRFTSFCHKEKKTFDEDVYSNTIIQCYESICRNGLKDTSQQGMRNYFFNSFKMNMVRCNTYCRETKRDYNIDMGSAYESYLSSNVPLFEKVKQQMLNDFTITYILNLVEQEFDIVSFFCFRIKHLIPKTSYQKLKEITKISDCKRRVVTINKWVKSNVNRDEVYKNFIENYPQFE